jgi:hypothetical protein
MTEEETIERLAQRVREEALAEVLAEMEAGAVISPETKRAAWALEDRKVQAVSSDASYGEPVAIADGSLVMTLDAVRIDLIHD